MSDDRPPSDAGAGAEVGDTPREGTPAFDELDGPLERKPAPPTTGEMDAKTDAASRKDTLQMNRRANVTLPDGVIGPAPDHASAYVPPHPAPKAAVQKTLEIDLVKVDARPDPRRAAATQKLPRIPMRGDPGYREPEPENETSDADDATDPEVTAPPASQRPGMGGLISIGVLAFAAVFVVGIVLFRVMGGGAPPPRTAPTPPAARQTDDPRVSSVPQKPEAVRAAPIATETPSAEPTTSAAPKPSTPQTTKPGKTEVKSPAPPSTAEPINH